jgi:hypothetical protein
MVMKNSEIPINGIYKEKVLYAKVLPGRESNSEDVKYGFNCAVTVYERGGEFLGVAEGGGAHNLPLTHNSPAIPDLIVRLFFIYFSNTMN